MPLQESEALPFVGGNCYVCKTEQECRPYGAQGQMICFDCMIIDPEREEEARHQFLLQARSAGAVAVIAEEAGPYPGRRTALH